MLILTSFQGIFNIKYSLIPDWWIGIYPLTYYFIGCYLKEYKVTIIVAVPVLLEAIYKKVKELHQINEYISKNGYEICGEPIDNYLVDIINTADEENYVTELIIPVK